jgi:hypothetical protein
MSGLKSTEVNTQCVHAEKISLDGRSSVLWRSNNDISLVNYATTAKLSKAKSQVVSNLSFNNDSIILNINSGQTINVGVISEGKVSSIKLQVQAGSRIHMAIKDNLVTITYRGKYELPVKHMYGKDKNVWVGIDDGPVAVTISKSMAMEIQHNGRGVVFNTVDNNVSNSIKFNTGDEPVSFTTLVLPSIDTEKITTPIRGMIGIDSDGQVKAFTDKWTKLSHD